MHQSLSEEGKVRAKGKEGGEQDKKVRTLA